MDHAFIDKVTAPDVSAGPSGRCKIQTLSVLRYNPTAVKL